MTRFLSLSKRLIILIYFIGCIFMALQYSKTNVSKETDNQKLMKHETINVNKKDLHLLSYKLNDKLYKLSSIERSEIESSEWINPSIITWNTSIIGYCCEIQDDFKCILQKFVLLFSMALFNKPTQNIYFQKCLRNGLSPKSVGKHNKISIKQRRDILLNNNNTKEWILREEDESIWFQPDMYLCQGFFWDKQLIETRTECNDSIDIQHEEVIDLLEYDISFGKTTQIPSHRLITYRPLLITTNTEFWGGGKCQRYDVVFDTVIGRGCQDAISIHAPPAFWYESMRINNKTSQLMIPDNDNEKRQYLENILSIKNSDMFHTLFLVKVCFMENRYSADAVVRVLFFDLLKNRYLNNNTSKQIAIDGLSSCRRDKEAIRKIGGHFKQRGGDKTFGYQGVRDGVVEMALKYKFMISMENSRTKGYMTEKFFNALYGYTIPIYFGDDMIDTYFNHKRFINCNISDDDAKKIHSITHKNKKGGIKNTEENILKELKDIIGDRLQECVDRVIEIDANDDKYRDMLLEPIFKDNKYDGSILDPFTMVNRLKQALNFMDSYLLHD